MSRQGRHPDYKGGTGRKYLTTFHGNQWTQAKKIAEMEEEVLKPAIDASSAKEYKLINTATSSELPETTNVQFEILDFKSVTAELEQLVACKTCGGDVAIVTCGRRSLGFKISVECKGECSKELKKIDSCVQIGKQRNRFCVNLRIVLAMRMIGVGRAGASLFCTLMDLPQPPSQQTYDVCNSKIHECAKQCADESMYNAAQKEKKLYVELPCQQATPDDLSFQNKKCRVGGDGTWRKRGYQSTVGVQVITGNETKKVLDVNIKCSYCQECTYMEKFLGTPEYIYWIDSHIEVCQANYEGSSGGMEPIGMLEMFRRSKEKNDIIYAEYIGDGDSKTFSHITSNNPYEEDGIQIKKLECVGHVQKRVGGNLRKMKKNKETCEDGGSLGGQGRLTDAIINDLQVWYGNAIRGNTNDVEKMRAAIWTSFNHIFSTDELPCHDTCKAGPESWCRYQKAKAKDELASYKHPRKIPEAVKKAVQPVFEKLTEDQLLKRWLGGFTQNNNESFNGLVWTLAPKIFSSGLKIVEIAVYLRVCVFNDGSTSLLKIMDKIGVLPGERAKEGLTKRDARRVSDANRAAQAASKESRQRNLRKRKAAEEAAVDEDGLFYLAGGFD